MRRKGILLAGIVALGISLVVPSVSQAGPFGFFGGRSVDGPFFGGGFYPYRSYGFFNRDFGWYPSYSVYYCVPSFPSNVVYSTSAYTPSPAPTFAKDRAYLTIQLPVDKADIWIEGVKSFQDVRSQAYVSPTIEPGKKYYYEVRAHWTDSKGKAVEMKRSFAIFAGNPVMVDFTKTQAPAEKK